VFNRFRLALIILALPASLGIALSTERANAQTTDEPAVSPALGISPTPERTVQDESDSLAADEFPVRSIDGSGNNLDNPLIGAALTPLVRRVDSDYANNMWKLAGPGRPGPREISNAVSAQDHSIPIADEISDFLWQWGQFLDHDVDLTGGSDPVESENFLAPADDPFFTPGKVFEFNRSFYDPASGTGRQNPRQQVNQITAWVDASNVYGSDAARADALRAFLGRGRLLTSDGDLLPFNLHGLPNAGGPDPSLFLAGDVRANEQVALTAMHTLFVREHNRLAGIYAAADPTLTGDEIYEKARRMVGAEMQAITYNEFLPLLLGENAIGNYEGYDPDLNAAFFAPQRIIAEGGIEPILRGLAKQVCQKADYSQGLGEAGLPEGRYLRRGRCAEFPLWRARQRIRSGSPQHPTRTGPRAAELQRHQDRIRPRTRGELRRRVL
jgi:hypothetical protein